MNSFIGDYFVFELQSIDSFICAKDISLIYNESF